METTDNVTIGAVGAGGDGVVLLGHWLQRLGALQGYFGQMPKYYGAQIRGGGSSVKLNLNSAKPSLPKDVLDVLVCFSWDKYAEFKDELPTGDHSVIIAAQDPPAGVVMAGTVHRIDLASMSKQLTSDAKNKNVIAFGIVVGILGFEQAMVRNAIIADDTFAVVGKSMAAFEHGLTLCSPKAADPIATLRMAAPMGNQASVIRSGNETIVEAAMAAGCTACFGYPITPASEIAEDMQERLVAVHGAFRQAEDEIAAIMNGIGASLAGAKVIVPTSGPGLSLMTEALGLAVGLETPLVIIDVQRGGPSTGVPTKTEQSDLWHAVFGGHGDAPRIVLAPHDMESMYRLTVEAFNVSEHYQAPTILLTDQYLGQTPTALLGDYRSAVYHIVNRRKPAVGEGAPYRRYAITPDFISPMSNIGDAGGVYQTAGLSHTENGSHDPSHDTLERWHEKLSKKLDPLAQRSDLARIYGNANSPDRIMTWGSSAQAVLAAVDEAGMNDRIAVCVPELLFPLPNIVTNLAESAKRLLIVEMNYSGQFFRYLRAMANPPSDAAVHKRSGARPFGISELVAAVQKYFGVAGSEVKS